MKNLFFLALVLVFAATYLQGCGGGSSSGDSSSSGSPSIGVAEFGEAGSLEDLGDLVEPEGDRWYYTQALRINDNGIVVGHSNSNSQTTRGAFLWFIDPLNLTDTMSFLGIAPSMTHSVAVDINNKSEVIVNSFDDEDNKETSLWRNGSLISIPNTLSLPNEYNPIKSNDINERGEVVGCAVSCGLEVCSSEICEEAFYWDGISSNSIRLGKSFGATDAEAVAINENRQIVINSGGTVVFHDLNHNVVESLNHLPEAKFSVAVDINDSIYTNNDGIPDGHVIGNSGNFDQSVLNNAIYGRSGLIIQTAATWVYDGGGSGSVDPPPEPVENLGLGEWGTDVKGFFWDGGAMYPISDLGGGASAVTDINNKDQVVGGALTADGKTRAILWTLGPDKKGVVRDLGTLGGDHSFALAINEAGQIVGWSSTGKFYTEDGLSIPIIHGFLWENGIMYDLGTHNYFYNYPFIPSYPFSAAVDINEAGELTGNSMTINDHSRGFYLQ